MSTSKVAICNGALQRLGAKRIESLTQDSANARAVNGAYDPARKRLLRRYDWGFAITRASIAADSEQTTWGGWNRFSLPDDYIRLLRDDESGLAVDWRIEGLYIVTADAAPLDIRYIADIEDPNFFDTLFVEALECDIAHEICKGVTGSNDLKDRMKADADDAIAEAKRLGAIEKPAQEAPEDGWITVRQ